MPEEKRTPDYEKLLRDISEGCKENCADCDYSKGTEFECSILNECAQAISALRAQVEKVTAERDDALEMLHSYRHICGEHTPDELSLLVQANDEGRCFIMPAEDEQARRQRDPTAQNNGDSPMEGQEPSALMKLAKIPPASSFKPFVFDWRMLAGKREKQKDMPPVPEVFCGPERNSFHCYRTCATLANEIKHLIALGSSCPSKHTPPQKGEDNG